MNRINFNKSIIFIIELFTYRFFPIFRHTFTYSPIYIFSTKITDTQKNPST